MYFAAVPLSQKIYDLCLHCYKVLLWRKIQEAGEKLWHLFVHHQNAVGWLCWQILLLAQTDGERGGVLLPLLVAMVKEEVKCVERQPL